MKTSKFCVTGLCEGNSPVTGEFPAQRASNAESVSIWWRHHDISLTGRLWVFVVSHLEKNTATYLERKRCGVYRQCISILKDHAVLRAIDTQWEHWINVHVFYMPAATFSVTGYILSDWFKFSQNNTKYNCLDTNISTSLIGGRGKHTYVRKLGRNWKLGRHWLRKWPVHFGATSLSDPVMSYC